MNRISVIVPIYNTIYYLDKCIRSILDQTYKEFELVLIDDGSNDGSEFRCDYYGSIDRRIRVIHQENHGLVYSRKIGCKEADGDYITFIDSDDWIENNYLMNLMSEMSDDVDLLVSNVVAEHDDFSVVLSGILKSGVYEQEDYEKELIPLMIRDWRTGKPGVQPFIVGKIFKKRKLEVCLQKNDNGITLGEDGAVSYPYLLDCQSIKIINYAGYHWMIHNASMSRKHTSDVFEKIEKLNAHMKIVFSESEHYQQILPQIHSWITQEFLLPAIRSFYGIEAGAIACIPPYELINKGEKLVIYGAGNCGKSFVRAIRRSDYATVVGWIDRNDGNTVYDIKIKKPEDIKYMDYEKVIIAVYDRHTYENIRQMLFDMGVEDNRIVWKEYDWG